MYGTATNGRKWHKRRYIPCTVVWAGIFSLPLPRHHDGHHTLSSPPTWHQATTKGVQDASRTPGVWFFFSDRLQLRLCPTSWQQLHQQQHPDASRRQTGTQKSQRMAYTVVWGFLSSYLSHYTPVLRTQMTNRSMFLSFLLLTIFLNYNFLVLRPMIYK